MNEENELCRACSGSGEGYYTTNNRCTACNGSGVETSLMHTQPETALEHYWFDLGHASNKIAQENNYLRQKIAAMKRYLKNIYNNVENVYIEEEYRDMLDVVDRDWWIQE